jgi:hypothetical protein
MTVGERRGDAGDQAAGPIEHAPRMARVRSGGRPLRGASAQGRPIDPGGLARGKIIGSTRLAPECERRKSPPE